jgi:hypothetical protein
VSTTALTKVGSSALSKLKPHVIRWFLKKYYPLDVSNLIIEFTSYPNIYLNYFVDEHTMWFDFDLKNFGLYELELKTFSCHIRVNGYDIIKIKEAVAYELKPNGTYKYNSVQQLTNGDVSRIKQHVPEGKFVPAEFLFHITARSRFRIEEIYLPDKKFCLQIRRQIPPTNIT